ncbi:MAG: MFS transporter [Promethearchaeota archaeon]|nr:MAG: MFS transporter [Candidatus Lokiarchaeota archaeon]
MVQKQLLKIFTGISSFQFLAMFRRGLFYTYLSIYLRDFLKLSMTETTLYATLPMIFSVIFQNFVWGPLSDRWQRRRSLIILGEILAGIGTILVWLIHSFFSIFLVAGYVIIIGLSCIEIFWSMSNIGWSALISDLYPLQDRSKIMGDLTSIGGVGRIIGITIGGYLYDNGFGFRNGPLFFIASLVMFLSTIPMFFAPEGGIKIVQETIKKTENANLNQTNWRRVFIIFTIALVFVNFGRNSISTIYSPYLILDEGFNVDSILLSYITNFRSIAVLITGIITGRMSKKFGDSKIFIIGVIFAITALLITGLTDDLLYIFIGSFLIGTTDVIISASSYTIASNLIPPKNRAKLFGVYNTTFFLSWGLPATLISGPLFDILVGEGFSQVFAYKTVIIVGAFITSIGFFIFLFLTLLIYIKKKHKIIP